MNVEASNIDEKYVLGLGGTEVHLFPIPIVNAEFMLIVLPCVMSMLFVAPWKGVSGISFPILVGPPCRKYFAHACRISSNCIICF